MIENCDDNAIPDTYVKVCKYCSIDRGTVCYICKSTLAFHKYRKEVCIIHKFMCVICKKITSNPDFLIICYNCKNLSA